MAAWAKPQALFPVTHDIIVAARRLSAADAFAGSYRLQKLKRECDKVWQSVDCMVTPTAGTIYTVAEMQSDPIQLNSNLGYYTNFMNLLNYSAVAVPAGFMSSGLLFGITVFAPAHQDVPLLHLAERLLNENSEHGFADAVPSGQISVAVCGAHLSGMALNTQLTERQARLIGKMLTTPDYRFYALPGGPPWRPGLVQVGKGQGYAIEVEVWEMPATAFGSFVAGIPAPLCIGSVMLESGEQVKGFLCEQHAVSDAADISSFGGWRAYLGSLR